ncbi:polyphosphate:AMP phosphotransferase [Hoeflea prorocentri]|uniref:Polyphosphate:AMP phosphotransferase n=1 Tax=Hoeflea prorocentri TaxID=1922333 RepID=A0A9X3ZIW1_9HYPH|nr:polyphosphate:AMP phosphotransferase [Hoeflea prorocentri]MCY6382155.1 polyphosphate:AMP phosphotransferase [Hoeflea prorocentri]MDA5399955.1 polyphosphate:AMP phosphotransferase [Hoeflea prorocentri]
MFETAELGRTISKADFKRAAPDMRQQLLELQDELHRNKRFSVVLLFAGVDGGGKGETVSLLNAWMDPRWLITRAYDDIGNSNSERPEFWKYWRDLPPRGRIGMFLSAWYTRPLLEKVHDKLDEASFIKQLERIAAFERALARDGTLILKFWMHLSREAQERRLKNLENDPLTAARVTERDWEHWRLYDKFIDTAEPLISRTNRGIAPWTVVEGTDANYRAITVTNILREAIERRFRETPQADEAASQPEPPVSVKNGKAKKGQSDVVEPANDAYETAKSITVLSSLNMAKKLEKQPYKERLLDLQARLHRLHLIAKAKNRSSVLLFEGPDAAGKGGAIRRINEALDARNYQVHGIAAPTDEELARHYLWRFWRRMPRDGYVTIFDRTWYGRVLVERIEGFANEDEWRRAYAEINEFEDQLIEHGTILVKYWIHITKDEQLARFKLREKTPYKRWKLTDEDWRNRDKWGQYEQAVNDLVQYTSTSTAPWTLVEGNDKRFARVKVVETYCRQLAEALDEPFD